MKYLCPGCEKEGLIFWGWAGVYYHLVCPEGHQWTAHLEGDKVVR